MRYQSYITALAAFILCLTEAGTAQVILSEGSYDMVKTTTAVESSWLNSNSVTDIIITGSTMWLGNGRGLSRSTDGGATW